MSCEVASWGLKAQWAMRSGGRRMPNECRSEVRPVKHEVMLWRWRSGVMV